MLSEALLEHYDERSDAALDSYSSRSLRRVWKAVRFSWWMTTDPAPLSRRCGFAQRVQAPNSTISHIGGRADGAGGELHRLRSTRHVVNRLRSSNFNTLPAGFRGRASIVWKPDGQLVLGESVAAEVA